MKHTPTFTKDRLPKEILSKFGLGANELDALPDEVMEMILAGEMTPVMTLSYTNKDKVTFKFKSRIRIVAKDTSTYDVQLVPQVPQASLERYTLVQEKELGEGKVLWYRGRTSEGSVVSEFHQVDPSTNNIIVVGTPKIARNLSILQNELALELEDLKIIREGSPRTIYSPTHGEVTVGIDLTVPSCIRIESGGKEAWKKSMDLGWDKYNFGVEGCWHTNSMGEMEYFRDTAYTEDILEYQRHLQTSVQR